MDDKHPDDYKDPKIFKEARIKLDLSQSALADIVGVKGGDVSIHRYEKGKRKISGPLSRLIWLLIKFGIPDIF